jgi:hypothetical protein
MSFTRILGATILGGVLGLAACAQGAADSDPTAGTPKKTVDQTEPDPPSVKVPGNGNGNGNDEDPPPADEDDAGQTTTDAGTTTDSGASTDAGKTDSGSGVDAGACTKTPPSNACGLVPAVRVRGQRDVRHHEQDDGRGGLHARRRRTARLALHDLEPVREGPDLRVRRVPSLLLHDQHGVQRHGRGRDVHRALRSGARAERQGLHDHLRPPQPVGGVRLEQLHLRRQRQVDRLRQGRDEELV